MIQHSRIRGIHGVGLRGNFILNKKHLLAYVCTSNYEQSANAKEKFRERWKLKRAHETHRSETAERLKQVTMICLC
jgi:hypothetical protein